jgi:23S rRNA (pseudouridine1915-N3)-methyltransferase
MSGLFIICAKTVFMKIRLIVVGKTRQEYVNAGFELYRKRVVNYLPFEMLVIPTLKNTRNLAPCDFRKKEGELILNAIDPTGWTVLLDEKGKSFDSEKFAGWLQKKMNFGPKVINFVVGGAYGFSDEVYLQAGEKLSLSRMTFSHQLIRVIFMEQLYRAFSIINNEPYHNP